MRGKTSSLLMDEQPLQILPSLAVKIGLNSAMFLQQIHYWIGKDSAHVRDNRRWVYNTYEGWHEQFPFWSPQVIRKRIVRPLEERGILVTTSAYNKMSEDKTKWYTIDYDALNALLADAKEPPDEVTTPTLNPPDKITTPPGQNNHTRTGQNNHTNNQRVPETNNRDSDLQSGETPEKAPAPTRAVNVKGWIVTELMERVNAARTRGAQILDPSNNDKKTLASMTEANWQHYDVDTFLRALDYMVAKAAGEINSEKAAWCYIGTAIREVGNGWRPRGHLKIVTPEHLAKVTENERLTAELLQSLANG